MSLRNRLIALERKSRLLRMRPDDIFVLTGVCTFDESGKIDYSFAKKIRVDKYSQDKPGILLVPKQRDKKEWQEVSIEYH